MRPFILVSVLLIIVNTDLFARSLNRVDHYDSRGKYLCTSYRIGNTTTYVDGHGKYTGQAVRESKHDYASYTGQGKYNGNTYVNGNSYEYFDGHGKFEGSAAVNGASYEYFDAHDHYASGAYAEGASDVAFTKEQYSGI